MFLGRARAANFVANSVAAGRFDVFVFGGVGASTPGPVGAGVEGISIVGLKGGRFYVGEIVATGVRAGLKTNHVARYTGTERVLSYARLDKSSITLTDIEGGLEVPFLAGAGVGLGRYDSQDSHGSETGGYGFAGADLGIFSVFGGVGGSIWPE